jgi:hypothetical protein
MELECLPQLQKVRANRWRLIFFKLLAPANKDAAFAGNLRRVRYARKSRDNSLTLPEIASSLLYAGAA